MRSPFDRIVAWAADRLGYVPAARLASAEFMYANMRRMRDEEVTRRERATARWIECQSETARARALEARAKEELEAAEAQNRRLQGLADTVLTARATALKYGLPLSQAFELEFRTHRELERDVVVHQIVIRPKSAGVSFAVDSHTLADMRNAPEVFIRRALPDLIAKFEATLGRALAAAVAV